MISPSWLKNDVLIFNRHPFPQWEMRTAFFEKEPSLWRPQETHGQYHSKIRELAATMDDHEIADQLNQNGLITAEGKAFTYAGVRWIRYKHSISGPYQRNRIGISVAEAATLLNISTGKIYYGISAGKIPARKQHPGWPWEILIDDSNLEAIRALYT